jgi:hypothetical protein
MLTNLSRVVRARSRRLSRLTRVLYRHLRRHGMDQQLQRLLVRAAAEAERLRYALTHDGPTPAEVQQAFTALLQLLAVEDQLTACLLAMGVKVVGEPQ